MAETFAQYLEKWLKQTTAQGLNNPLVKMPIKRFRPLEPTEFESLANGGVLTIGTLSDPIARNLYKNAQTRIRERGEHCGFICYGAIAMTIAGGSSSAEKEPPEEKAQDARWDASKKQYVFAEAPQKAEDITTQAKTEKTAKNGTSSTGHKSREALFPICLKRASFQLSGDKIRVLILDDEIWQFNPMLNAYLRDFGITFSSNLLENPSHAINWLKAQLGNRARVSTESYVGLFSSQQMVVQQRLNDPPLRQALAHNPIIKAKIENQKVNAVELTEITDDGLENLGIILPCDDSQLKVVQISNHGCCLQVEGPPGTGKSQTIANIISNALYHGRSVLLVCDKKAAIVQVEERLTNCGLKPAILNLHDEDLDKREFLKQATNKFGISANRANYLNYPFEQLRETRKTLNERVIFGRAIAHPSLQVQNRQALSGLLQLRKELKNIPNINIANWQSLSKERLTRLLNSIAEWPGLSIILSDSSNVWNKVRTEAFDENPNATNELTVQINSIFEHLENLDETKAWIATVGIELPIKSDIDMRTVLALAELVIKKPNCHPKLIGNGGITLAELKNLEDVWKKRKELENVGHPVPLNEIYTSEINEAAKNLVENEKVISWDDLSKKEAYYSKLITELNEIQNKYSRFCNQIGFIYAPLQKTRRAQLQAVLELGKFGGLIPREWWDTDNNPVLIVNGWIGKLRTCIGQSKLAPLPLHFIAFERIAPSHWKHVEAMAEHGFNIVSYCFKFVNDRKCKYALRQAYPSIPARGFKQWREVTLHAVASLDAAKSLRTAAEPHSILKQLTENYLSVAHDAGDSIQFIEHADVSRLQAAATLVEQYRKCNDLFEISSIHWQTFWASPNPNVLTQVENFSLELDRITLPDNSLDDIDKAIVSYEQARTRIRTFLELCEKIPGNRSNPVLKSFDAQKEYAVCTENLIPLVKYVELQNDKSRLEWQWLHEIIEWRDSFERLSGKQKLDIDSTLWVKLSERLQAHCAFMEHAYKNLDNFFEEFRSADNDYDSLKLLLGQILAEIQRIPLWLEKKQWNKKISAFPELKEVWSKVLDGDVPSEHARPLFCFNLLRLCEPIARPRGAELTQVVRSFVEQDENLSLWILDELKTKLFKGQSAATVFAAQSESELRRLAGLQRVRGTVRELVNAHFDYLRSAKLCWMISPTSLANLMDSNIFEKHGIPFDMVIFDEASQIRVLDGLLSMSFGKQVIIVGDKNQLPPTDFFASFAYSEFDAETADFGISESLLDEFSGVFSDDSTHAMLMSHYRSETPDLIRFSNDWFYNGQLEMYPPAHISGIGRRHHYVPNAIYSETSGQRNNPIEADEVVKLIGLHVREYPEKSLGIVTMNIPQMELIDERLQEMQSDAVRAFCANEANFFLRNLETVQGDEMDRIILSLTYGKNASGKFNASVLGPLTKSGGERRLNVAITRSRNGMIVVSSLKAADLESTGAQSKGFQCLKAFLSDLEATEKARNFGIGSKRFERQRDGVSNIIFCDSPFEEQIVEFLENEGYDIECQYGAGKFRLDIVVKEKGKHILAIECDGAAYHSSLVARTRDRARQKILENLGWRFHRVWSTNWWLFEQQEKEAIVAAINSARQNQLKQAKA